MAYRCIKVHFVGSCCTSFCHAFQVLSSIDKEHVELQDSLAPKQTVQ